MRGSIAGILFILVVLGAVFAGRIAVYRECRAHGFSTFYCFATSGR